MTSSEAFVRPGSDYWTAGCDLCGARFGAPEDCARSWKDGHDTAVVRHNATELAELRARVAQLEAEGGLTS